MKIKLTFLCLILFCYGASAEQEILFYLYEVDLSPKQQEIHKKIKGLANNAEFEAAINLSESLLATRQTTQEEKDPYGQLVINHGIIKSADLDYSNGLIAIEEGLILLERNHGPFSPSLVRGIMAKAITEFFLKLPEKAEDSFRRAQHIVHRDKGVYGAPQLPVLSWITKTNLQQGKFLSADREQRFSLRVAEQSFGKESVDLIPFLNSLGAYFASRGSTIPQMLQTDARLQRDLLFRQSTNLYQRAVGIIEQNFGQNDIRLVKPLRGLANARILQATNRKYAESALLRSLAIVNSHPGSDLTDRTQAMVDLADLYTITKNGRASELYLEAWQLLQENEQTRQLANRMFDSPQRLFPRLNDTLYLDRRPDAAGPDDDLFARIEYTVTDSGKVSYVKVLEKNVPNEQVRILRYRLRNAKFRPRIVEGEIIATEGLTFYQPYEVLKRTNETEENQINEPIDPPLSAPQKQMY